MPTMPGISASGRAPSEPGCGAGLFCTLWQHTGRFHKPSLRSVSLGSPHSLAARTLPGFILALDLSLSTELKPNLEGAEGESGQGSPEAAPGSRGPPSSSLTVTLKPHRGLYCACEGRPLSPRGLTLHTGRDAAGEEEKEGEEEEREAPPAMLTSVSPSCGLSF